MSLPRIAALAGRILRQFRRDVRTVALIAIVPLLVMALVGYLISESKEPLPVAVVNLDRGADTPAGRVAIGDEIVRGLREQGSIAVRPAASLEAAEGLVRSGDVGAALLLPSDLSARTLAGEVAPITVVVLGTEPGLDGPVMRAIGGAMSALAGAEGPAPDGGPLPSAPGVAIERLPLEGGEHLSTLDYYAPVLICAFVFLFTFMLTSVAFLRERSSGTLERLMASPATRVEVLLGYLLGFLGFAVFQALLILGYAVWILDVRVAGSIWLVLLVLVILVTGVVNLGIALSFYARNELQVVQFIPLIFVPQVFLGGLVWPVQTLYPALRWLSQAFPLTHATVALRSVMVGGEGLGDILDRILALLAFAGAMVVLGVLALRRQKA